MAINAETISEIFRNSVNQAQEFAKKTKDDGQKGLIYATLALAMANTGVVNFELSEAAEAAPQPETTREDLKPKAAKKTKKVETAHKGSEDVKMDENMTPVNDTEPEAKTEAEVEEAQPPEKAGEAVFGAEWTDEAVAHFAKEAEFIQEHQGKLYEVYYEGHKEEGMSDDDADASAQQETIEFFNSEIEKATCNACHTQEDINPMNIKFIVEFLKAVERGEDPAEGAYLPY